MYVSRWLISRGKVNDAIKVLRRFERVNDVKIPNELMAEFIVSKLKFNIVLMLYPLI